MHSLTQHLQLMLSAWRQESVHSTTQPMSVCANAHSDEAEKMGALKQGAPE